MVVIAEIEKAADLAAAGPADGAAAAADADTPVKAGTAAPVEPEWNKPPFGNKSLVDVRKAMGFELDDVKFPDGYFAEAMYHEQMPVSRSVDQHVDDLEDSRDATLVNANFEYLRQVFTCTYFPGEYEFKTFKELDREDWGALAGQRPTGFHFFPIGFLGSKSGFIPFPNGWTAANFVAKSGDASFTEVKGWKDLVECMLMMDKPDDEPTTTGDRFVRPPQAAYSRTRNMPAEKSRNKFAKGDRQVTPTMRLTGKIKVIFECKGAGFRKDLDTPNCAALCHAAVLVTIDGTEATGISVEIKEAVSFFLFPYGQLY